MAAGTGLALFALLPAPPAAAGGDIPTPNNSPNAVTPPAPPGPPINLAVPAPTPPAPAAPVPEFAEPPCPSNTPQPASDSPAVQAILAALRALCSIAVPEEAAGFGGGGAGFRSGLGGQPFAPVSALAGSAGAPPGVPAAPSIAGDGPGPGAAQPNASGPAPTQVESQEPVPTSPSPPVSASPSLQGGGLSGATAGPGTAVAAAPRSGGRLFSPRRPAPLTARTTPAPTGAITGELNEREVIVAVPLGRTSRDDAALAADQGLTMISAVNSRLLGRRIVRYAISGTRTVTEVLTALSQDGRVVSVQPNYVFRIIGAAGTKLPAPQYAPDKIGLAAAHKLARGRRVKVAVIDTALDPAHPELKGAIAASLVAIDGPVKPEAHGTAIAGVAGARGTLAGIAPEAALLPVAAFRSSGAGAAQSTTYALVQGIEWSHGQGARVVNMSFAGPEDALLGEFIAAASARGAIFVAAAGNAGPEAEPAFPAAFPHVIAVTATDDRDVLYKDANRGAYIAIAAPGVDILAPGLSGTYELSSGTSLAAAHVSGLAALMLERKPSLTTTKVRAMLARTARMPGSRPAATEVGAGIIDAAGAVGSAR